MPDSGYNPQLRILFVDDEETDRALFGIAIERADLDVWLETFNDGQQAMDHLDGKAPYDDRSLHPLPDLIVLDLRMPGMSGIDFLVWRKSSPLAAAIPVVILTGSIVRKHIQQAIELGAKAVFEKPAGFDQWKAVVREIAALGLKLKSS